MIQKHKYIDLGKAVKRQYSTLLPTLAYNPEGKHPPVFKMIGIHISGTPADSIPAVQDFMMELNLAGKCTAYFFRCRRITMIDGYTISIQL